MSESSGVRIDLLKPHVQAIVDEVRRAGPEACRAAQYEVEARLPEELQAVAADVGSPDCAGLHVLAAVALQISIDQVLAGESGIDMLLEAVQWQPKAEDCEAKVAAAATVGEDG